MTTTVTLCQVLTFSTEFLMLFCLHGISKTAANETHETLVSGDRPALRRVTLAGYVSAVSRAHVAVCRCLSVCVSAVCRASVAVCCCLCLFVCAYLRSPGRVLTSVAVCVCLRSAGRLSLSVAVLSLCVCMCLRSAGRLSLSVAVLSLCVCVCVCGLPGVCRCLCLCVSAVCRASIAVCRCIVSVCVYVSAVCRASVAVCVCVCLRSAGHVLTPVCFCVCVFQCCSRTCRGRTPCRSCCWSSSTRRTWPRSWFRRSHSTCSSCKSNRPSSTWTSTAPPKSACCSPRTPSRRRWELPAQTLADRAGDF